MGRGGPSDRGADVLAKLEEIDGIHSYVIQVKRYTNTKVGEQTVMLLHSTMQALNCDRGIVITTSDFTVDAVEVAKKLGVRLINGLQLARLIQQYQVPIPLTAPQEQAEEEDRAPVPHEELVEEKVEDSFYSRPL
ncbi:MAG: restriction endonuclease [Candidatus Aramenus sulfurataquae]|uniref:Restriction endonuclease n=2 Tax=Candidatus Aramenus sulfurataquae TaxID=1326980 RepID=W7KVK3_9CREN|nr:MAG: restriction endonuclease [Candidatus Aramenus sulfurataquae]